MAGQSPAKSTRHTQRKKPASQGKRKKARQGSLALAVLSGLMHQNSGRLVLGILLTALIFFIEALIMKQNYLMFFRIVGIELILLMFIGWIFFMVQDHRPE